MTKTYAAFYLPPEEKEVKLPDQKNVDRIKSSVSRALQNAKQSVLNFDVNAMARNMDLQSSTEFVQRYATGALSKIMQAGNGQINVANFVQGFSNGLSIVQSAADKTDYRSKYGEEIPIDVVEQCKYLYKADIAHNKINEQGILSDYISDLDPLRIELKAHVKNDNAELWNINDFNNKLVDIMMKKQEVIFRVGKSIYENCTISKYEPTITNIHDIYFIADINLNYNLNMQSQNAGKTTIMNPKRLRGDFNNFNYNIACKEVYRGIVS